MTDNAEDTIRVLIVDDFAETRENIRKLLQFESDIAVVGAARSGEEAIQIAQDTKPDVVLMDINMSDMDGITATEAILQEVPFTQIVILSVQSEPDYMRRAMLAGARDFMVKPPSSDELISTIRNVAVMAHEQRKKHEAPLPQVAAQIPGAEHIPSHRPMGRVLAFYSPKGGVGCSPNLPNQQLISLAPKARSSFLPGVITAPRHLQDLAHRHYSELSFVSPDEPETIEASFAKKIRLFFKISRSSRKRLLSRRKAPNSSWGVL